MFSIFYRANKKGDIVMKGITIGEFGLMYVGMYIAICGAAFLVLIARDRAVKIYRRRVCRG